MPDHWGLFSLSLTTGQVSCTGWCLDNLSHSSLWDWEFLTWNAASENSGPIGVTKNDHSRLPPWRNLQKPWHGFHALDCNLFAQHCFGAWMKPFRRKIWLLFLQSRAATCEDFPLVSQSECCGCWIQSSDGGRRSRHCDAKGSSNGRPQSFRIDQALGKNPGSKVWFLTAQTSWQDPLFGSCSACTQMPCPCSLTGIGNKTCHVARCRQWQRQQQISCWPRGFDHSMAVSERRFFFGNKRSNP